MCNGCHDMSTKAISMHNLCIRYNNANAYRINFVFIYAVIIDKKETL